MTTAIDPSSFAGQQIAERNREILNIPVNKLPADLQASRAAIEKADAARAKAEEAFRLKREARQAYEQRRTNEAEQMADIAIGEKELATAKQDNMFVDAHLENFISLGRSRPKGFVDSLREQRARNDFWISFLDGWLDRRRASLAEHVKTTAEFAKKNGIETQ